MIINWKTKNSMPNKLEIYFPILFIIVWLLTWISSFGVWVETLKNIQTLISEGAPTHLQTLTGNLIYAQVHGYSILQQFLKVYGGIAIYVILAIVTFSILIKKVDKNPNTRNILIWYGPWVICGVMVIGLYFTNIVLGGGRFFPPVVLISTLFIGYLFNEMLINLFISAKRIFIQMAIVTLIFICTFVLGILQVYPSPYTLLPNDQPTRTEAVGVNWYFKNKDITINSLQITCNLNRYADIMLTPLEISTRGDIPPVTNYPVPNWHFGYNIYGSLGAQYSTDQYLIVNSLDTKLYNEIYPSMAESRFTKNDFTNLEQDVTVTEIYSNSGFNVYCIHPP
jgi:hypothetical protein